MSAVAAPVAELVPSGTYARLRSLTIYGAIGTVALVIYVIARSGYYTAGSRLGYWLGVVGAVLMLLLMLYPVSKRIPALQRLAAIRYWFSVHMLFGVLGPVLILLHCTLRIGSLNAAVAFWSMVVVASSGVFGRFLYGRLHAGLYGRQRTFAEVAGSADQLFASAALTLGPAPALLAELRAYGLHAAAVGLAGWRRPFALAGLGPLARRCMKRCRGQLIQSPDGRASSHLDLPWETQALIQRYLAAARDSAQFQAFDSVFAMWHALHIPLVALLALSAVVHVVAVHMY